MSSVNIEPRLPALHSRIRRRRAQIGLTGTQLGQRAGISASYVSVIENGAKVPEEGVAAALARALGDDEALYRAWARAARLGVHDLALLNELAAIARTPALASLVESGEALRRRRSVTRRAASSPAACVRSPSASRPRRRVSSRFHCSTRVPTRRGVGPPATSCCSTRACSQASSRRISSRTRSVPRRPGACAAWSPRATAWC